MRHAARDILFILTTLLLVWPIGCHQSESDHESEPDEQMPVEGGLRLAEEARASIGIVAAPVQSRFLPSGISTTGWLTQVPQLMAC